MTGVDDARALLLAGADKVAVNRAAFDDPSILTRLADEFGSQAVVVRDRRACGRGRDPRGRARRAVATRSTGRVEAVERGAGEILLTSIDADGTRAGYDLPLTRGGRRRPSRCP